MILHYILHQYVTSDEDSGYTLGGSDPIEASRRSTASSSGIRICTFLVSQNFLFLTLVEIIVWKLMKLLKESIALVKERMKADTKKSQGDLDLINQLVKLLIFVVDSLVFDRMFK